MKDMALVRSLEGLLEMSPSQYLEMDLKLEITQAIAERSERRISTLLSLEKIASRTSLDDAGAKAMQKALLSKMVTESLAQGTFDEQRQRLQAWLDAAVCISSDGLPSDLRRDLCHMQQFLAYSKSSETISDLEVGSRWPLAPRAP